MPMADGMRTGSDHGPAGSSACTSSCPPSSDQLVVIIQNRPSWWRSVGAKMPPDGPAFETSSCDGSCSAWPISSHERRSVERKIGTPGAYSKLDVAR